MFGCGEIIVLRAAEIGDQYCIIGGALSFNMRPQNGVEVVKDNEIQCLKIFWCWFEVCAIIACNFESTSNDFPTTQLVFSLIR